MDVDVGCLLGWRRPACAPLSKSPYQHETCGLAPGPRCQWRAGATLASGPASTVGSGRALATASQRPGRAAPKFDGPARPRRRAAPAGNRPRPRVPRPRPGWAFEGTAPLSIAHAAAGPSRRGAARFEPGRVRNRDLNLNGPGPIACQCGRLAAGGGVKTPAAATTASGNQRHYPTQLEPADQPANTINIPRPAVLRCIGRAHAGDAAARRQLECAAAGSAAREARAQAASPSHDPSRRYTPPYRAHCGKG